MDDANGGLPDFVSRRLDSYRRGPKPVPLLRASSPIFLNEHTSNHGMRESYAAGLLTDDGLKVTNLAASKPRPRVAMPLTAAPAPGVRAPPPASAGAVDASRACILSLIREARSLSDHITDATMRQIEHYATCAPPPLTSAEVAQRLRTLPPAAGRLDRDGEDGDSELEVEAPVAMPSAVTGTAMGLEQRLPSTGAPKARDAPPSKQGLYAREMEAGTSGNRAAADDGFDDEEDEEEFYILEAREVRYDGPSPAPAPVRPSKPLQGKVVDRVYQSLGGGYRRRVARTCRTHTATQRRQREGDRGHRPTSERRAWTAHTRARAQKGEPS